MTAEPWAPRVVPGGGRRSRQDRREAEMRNLWAEAWELADADSRDEALDVFLEANDLGMSFDADESRVCRLTGTVALGRARMPFTDWEADVAVSHGRDEDRPTALDRYVGWEDLNGNRHAPERIVGRAAMKGGQASALARKGLEPAFVLLGLDRPGATVELRYSRNGTLELHPGGVDAGPMPVED